jgi:hypothetical protein
LCTPGAPSCRWSAGIRVARHFDGCARDALNEATIYDIGVAPRYRGLARLLVRKATQALFSCKSTFESARSGPIGMEQLWNRGGASGGKRSTREGPEDGSVWGETVATGCHGLPLGSHGKECHEEGPPR